MLGNCAAEVGDPEGAENYYQQAIDLARRALLHNAWQEQAVELCMRAVLQLGERGIAMNLYRRLEKKLDQELGIVPQAELQSLFAEARKQPG